MAPSRAKAILSLPRAIAAESSARSACSSRYAARRSLHSSRASRQEKSDSKDSESPSRPSTSIPLGPPGPSGSVTPNEGTTPRITKSTAGPSSVRNPNNLPAWIPPKWHPHLQPDAQWRKELLDRRRRLLEQAGEQLTVLGLKLNEVTGYREVERLKDLVEQKETKLKWLRDDAKIAKDEYERAVTTRATTQSDVNSLLERKHAWSDEDVSRFTQLVRSDHSSNQAVTTTAIALKETEIATDKAFSDLMQAILQRYHEEQVWSDKIRNVSTYAGLAGLLVNLVVFVGAIAFVEPWKRKRLVERLEERIAGMMDQVEGSIDGLGQKVERDMALIRSKAGVVEEATLAGQEQEPLASELELSPPVITIPTRSSPLGLGQTLDRVSPYLDRLAGPSQDRDIVFSASVGALAGVTVTALGLWLGR